MVQAIVLGTHYPTKVALTVYRDVNKKVLACLHGQFCCYFVAKSLLHIPDCNQSSLQFGPHKILEGSSPVLFTQLGCWLWVGSQSCHVPVHHSSALWVCCFFFGGGGGGGGLARENQCQHAHA